MKKDYAHVTEVSGDYVSKEQLQRMYSRYAFAKHYCEGKDVLEVACGSGQGLGFLKKSTQSLVGGDFSDYLLRTAQSYYGSKIPLVRLDAQRLPFKTASFDVVILFEAIYYLQQHESFFLECNRVLRPQGHVIICNANKDLPDFNPSPYSYRYFSPSDFSSVLGSMGFGVECFGDCEVDYDHPKQRFFSLLKRMIVRFDLMPKTMAGKKFLKRLVFGKLVLLPAELPSNMSVFHFPIAVDTSKADIRHKVVFAVGQKRS
jgi:ubiquinone/menaquinone biosynthesis C-methylase UbiE